MLETWRFRLGTLWITLVSKSHLCNPHEQTPSLDLLVATMASICHYNSFLLDFSVDGVHVVPIEDDPLPAVFRLGPPPSWRPPVFAQERHPSWRKGWNGEQWTTRRRNVDKKPEKNEMTIIARYHDNTRETTTQNDVFKPQTWHTGPFPLTTTTDIRLSGSTASATVSAVCLTTLLLATHSPSFKR